MEAGEWVNEYKQASVMPIRLFMRLSKLIHLNRLTWLGAFKAHLLRVLVRFRSTFQFRFIFVRTGPTLMLLFDVIFVKTTDSATSYNGIYCVHRPKRWHSIAILSRKSVQRGHLPAASTKIKLTLKCEMMIWYWNLIYNYDVCFHAYCITLDVMPADVYAENVTEGNHNVNTHTHIMCYTHIPKSILTCNHFGSLFALNL